MATMQTTAYPAHEDIEGEMDRYKLRLLLEGDVYPGDLLFSSSNADSKPICL